GIRDLIVTGVQTCALPISETTSIHAADAAHAEHETMTKGRIWKVFFILLGITCIEFIIALYLAPHYHIPSHWINPIYIVLTLFRSEERRVGKECRFGFS